MGLRRPLLPMPAALRRGAQNAFDALPLRLTVTLPLLAVIGLAVAGTAAWSFHEGRLTAEGSASGWRDEISWGVSRTVALHLGSLRDITEMNLGGPRGTTTIPAKLSAKEIGEWEQRFLTQLKAFHDVSFIGLGTAGGDFIAAERLESGSRIRIVVRSAETRGDARSFTPLDGLPRDDGHGEALQRGQAYDATKRNWYAKAVRVDGAPTWSNAFAPVTGATNAVSVSVAVLDAKTRAVLGVLTAGTSLEQLGRVLEPDRPIAEDAARARTVGILLDGDGQPVCTGDATVTSTRRGVGELVLARGGGGMDQASRRSAGEAGQ